MGCGFGVLHGSPNAGGRRGGWTPPSLGSAPDWTPPRLPLPLRRGTMPGAGGVPPALVTPLFEALKNWRSAHPRHIPSFPAPNRCHSPRRAGREAPAASQSPAVPVPLPREGPCAPSARPVATSQVGGERDPLPNKRGSSTWRWLGRGGTGRSQPDPSQTAAPLTPEQDPVAGVAPCPFQSLPSGFWLFPGMWLCSWRWPSRAWHLTGPRGDRPQCWQWQDGASPCQRILGRIQCGFSGGQERQRPTARAGRALVRHEHRGGSETGTGKIFP